MSEFHYVRTTGVDGGVDAADGPAIGVDLETILKDGLPPVKVAMQIIAALCEILDIADEDGEIHGDVSPEFIFVDDTGAVSLEGFGTDRDSKHAPEGEPVGTSTDLYGLGFTAFRLLSSEPLEPPIDDPDDHDDSVIDAVVGMNFGDIPEEFHGDIQWFLAKLMAWEPDDRPPAIEAWRTFIAFADETPGTEIEDWAADAIEGGGERRDAAQTGRQELPEPEEDLSGPTKMKGPLAKGAIDFSGSTAKPGGATAFWSKDALKGALAAEPTDDGGGDFGDGGGGGGGGGAGFTPKAAQSTSFWSKEQMEAMRTGGEAPRPKRGGGSNRPPRAVPPQGPGAAPPGPPGGQPPPPGGEGRHFAPTVPPEVDASAPPLQNQPPPPGGFPGAVAQGPAAQGPVAQGPAAQGPVAQGPGGMGPGGMGARGPVPPGVAPPGGTGEEGGGRSMMLAGVVGVVFLLLCLGIGGVVGGLYLFGGKSSSSSSSTSTTEEPEPEPSPKPHQDTAAPAPAPEPAPAPKATPTPRPSPRPAPRPAPAPSPRPAPRPTPRPMTRPSPRPAPAPAPVSGKVKVTFDLGGRGTVGCSDGQQRDVDGSRTVEFEGYMLPLSCMIQVGSDRWAGLISRGGTLRCSGSGPSFKCSGP